ncbi:hypothetical protein RCO28_02580 [Streptomyces sp. LHD-70]|nr:hypothetical protein [Streptomyces sp. LHD-70]MDQ8701375.1 hypothetical protein [Streptomyces sp. LHD-70]
MDECPTAANETPTAAKIAARKARKGDRASVIGAHSATQVGG